MSIVRAMRPIHPGEVLREDVVPSLNMMKARIARAIGISRQTFYDLLGERQAVTPLVALKLERCVGGSAEMWMNLQRDYDLAVARRDKADEIAKTEHLEVA
jgi:addiction module HigA family antidote